MKGKFCPKCPHLRHQGKCAKTYDDHGMLLVCRCVYFERRVK